MLKSLVFYGFEMMKFLYLGGAVGFRVVISALIQLIIAYCMLNL